MALPTLESVKRGSGLIGPRARMLGLVAFTNLFVALMVATWVDISYRQYQERAEIASRNTNRLVSQSVAGDIDQVDLGLLTGLDEIRRLDEDGVRDPVGHIAPFLARLKARLPMAEAVRVLDADGNLVAGSERVPPGINNADRDYFRRAHDDPAAGLVISQPIVSRVNNTWVLVFARAIRTRDGGFAGVIFLPVRIDWFERKFEQLNVGARGAVVMRGDASRDFDLLSRFPHAGYVGQTKVSDTFRATIGATPQGGTYRAVAGADGIERTFSYQHVAGYPLITLVGLATGDYLGDWRRDTLKIVGLLAGFVVVTSLGGWGTLSAWRKLEQRSEELRLHKEHLEELVDERTASLKVAVEQAQASSRAKSVFLASMSHELRTPLNAILGFSEILRTEMGLSPEQHQSLDLIHRSGRHLLNLINDVLDMAKIEAGHTSVDDAPFDLGEMTREVIDLMRVRAEEKGLELFWDQSSAFPRVVRSDATKLRQVLINVIGNAVKFTERGFVRLRLTACEAPLHRILLIFEVKDTGPGIPAEELAHIFEPFVQGGRTTTTQKGTGLGLSITRQYVELMGGQVAAESTIGEGSCFRVEVPARHADPAEIEVQAPSHGRVAGVAPGQPDYRILIVEDQIENWLLLRRMLENAGLTVRVAENGQQAVDLFQSWRPHFIWMDIRMPVLDGLEAARRIRALDGGHEVKIAAVTASVFQEERDRVMAAGMDDFLRKPFQAAEIFDCLTRNLGIRFLHEEGKTAPAAAPPVIIPPEAIAALPEDLRRQLRKAVVELDSAEVSATLARVAELDGDLGRALAHYADRLAYSAILHAIGGETP